MPRTGQSMVRGVAWLLVVALLNLSVSWMHATVEAAPADGDTLSIAICTSHGAQTVALTDEAPQQAGIDCSCRFCPAPAGVVLPLVPLAEPSKPTVARDAALAESRDDVARLWFLDGRPLRAPPRA